MSRAIAINLLICNESLIPVVDVSYAKQKSCSLLSLILTKGDLSRTAHRGYLSDGSFANTKKCFRFATSFII